MSTCRQNYSVEVEDAINKQIHHELSASYQYLAMATYLDRESVALPGCRDFFKKQSDEEKMHAQLLIDYQNKRSGCVSFSNITLLKQEWNSAIEMFQLALVMESQINQCLLDLHKLADNQGDTHCCDFIESTFLSDQVDSAKQLSDLITQLKRCGDGVGLYLFDQNLKV
jgi:ferritin heavy chain